MAVVAEQEKQKITFPEIRDLPEDPQSAAAVQAEDDSEGVSIDVDIENMEWEVESASDDDSSGLDHDDYSDEYDDVPQADEYDPGDDTVDIRYSRKINKHIFTWLFSFLLGMYGVDRFVRGQIGLGVLKILSFGGFGIWYMVDLIIALYKSYVSDNSDFEDLFFDDIGRYIL